MRRVGGGFGAKQSRSIYLANAVTLAALHTQRPVLMQLTLEDNMEILGRRQPWRIEYQVKSLFFSNSYTFLVQSKRLAN